MKLIFDQAIDENENQVIYNEIGISAPGKPQIKVIALFDTGSCHSAISFNLAKILNLRPVETGRVLYGAIVYDASIYHMDINLNGIIINDAIVSDMPQSEDGIKFIIGMSVIRLGDFQIRNGKAKFYLPDLEDDECNSFSSGLQDLSRL